MDKFSSSLLKLIGEYCGIITKPKTNQVEKNNENKSPHKKYIKKIKSTSQKLTHLTKSESLKDSLTKKINVLLEMGENLSNNLNTNSTQEFMNIMTETCDFIKNNFPEITNNSKTEKKIF